MVDDQGGATRPVTAVDRGPAVRETAAALFLLVFAVAFTLMAFGFGEEARRLPLVVGFPLTVLALINMILVVRDQRFRGPGGSGTAGTAPTDALEAPSDNEEQEDQAAALRRAQSSAGNFEGTGEGLSFRASLAALAVVTALFMLFGLIPAAVLFTTGYMRIIGREPWVKALGISAVLVALFWLFNTFLNVRFYEGWLAAEDYIPYFLPF